jgi:large subunit ribosomal protein L10
MAGASRSFGERRFCSLAKEIVEIQKKPEFEKCQARGGVMDGERFTAEKVKEISKWPNRVGQISILLGQILSPGRNCSRSGRWRRMASQIERNPKKRARKRSPIQNPKSF